MIRLRRLDGKEFVLNALLVETVEAVPDTVIALTTGRKLVVKEAVDAVVAAVAAYHRSLGTPAGKGAALPGPEPGAASSPPMNGFRRKAGEKWL